MGWKNPPPNKNKFKEFFFKARHIEACSVESSRVEFIYGALSQRKDIAMRKKGGGI